MRILHIVPDIGVANGVMSVVLNYAAAMPENIKFDILYFAEKEKTRKSDIEALGGRVFKTDFPSLKDLAGKKAAAFFDAHKNEWSAVHVHCPHFLIFIAPAARKAGIKKVAVHCHSTWYSLKPENSLRNKLLYSAGAIFADKRFACGRKAGIFWFKSDKKFTVLPNGVNFQKFAFCSDKREAMRKELGICGKFAVGNVGRVYPIQKNHPFVLEVFAKIKEKNRNSVLLLAGADKTPELCALAKRLNISDSVMFLGQRNDVERLLQAFDVFLFPSLREGLPVCVVEAQAASLPAVMSDCVTDEVVFKKSFVRSLSLNLGADEWAREVVSLFESTQRAEGALVENNAWSISSCAEKLAEYYLN